VEQQQTLHLSENAIRVLEARYLRRDAQRQIVESPKSFLSAWRAPSHRRSRRSTAANYGANTLHLTRRKKSYVELQI
jgi:hypothetical protein